MKEKGDRVTSDLERNKLTEDSYIPSSLHQRHHPVHYEEGMYGPWSLNQLKSKARELDINCDDEHIGTPICEFIRDYDVKPPGW